MTIENSAYMFTKEDGFRLPLYAAYHTTGLKYLMEDVCISSIERARQQYLAICAAGHLRPAQRVEESSMRVEDRLAGDNRYVFLSVNEANWGPVPAQAQFGFIFDAPTLIDQGAILRPYDLYDTYWKTLNELAAEEIGWYTWRDAIPQDMEKYGDRHCAFLKALRSLDETVLGVRHVLIQFRQKAQQLFFVSVTIQISKKSEAKPL